VTLAALYLPGMRDLERSDASARVEGVVETV